MFSPVQCFLQDSKNYIWMGGRALQRYDGYRFKNYFDGREHLSVQCLFEDNQQNMWAGTDRGVYRLNKKTDKFELFQDSMLSNGKKVQMNITAISDDGNGTLWFGALKFYAALNTTTRRIEDVSTMIGFDKKGNGGVINKDADGNLWFRFPKPYGLVRYNWKSKTTSSHFNNPLNETVFNIDAGNAIVIPDKNDNVWFSESFDSRELFRYNTVSLKLYKYRLSYPPGMYKAGPAVSGRFIVDSHGLVWIKLEERMGIARYNPAADSFEYLYSDNDSKNGLHDVYSITNASGAFYEDKQGNFWQGGTEVNFFSPYKQVFQTFRLSDYLKEGAVPRSGNTSNTAANSFLLMPDNKIYAAFYGDGLWRCNQELLPEKKIQLPESVSPLLWHIFSPDFRKVFISDQFRKISVYDIQTGATELKTYSEFPPVNIVTSLVENDSTVWLGLWTEATSRFNPLNGHYSNYKSAFTANPAERLTILSFCRKDTNHIWVAASNGLHLFNTVTNKAVSCWQPDNSTTNGGPNLIRHISQLNNDTLLLCSNNGFIIYNSRKNTANILTIKDGMPDNICYASLVENNKQYVWINTANKGLCRLHIPTLSVTAFQDNDGMEMLNGTETCFTMPDSRFVFANNNGFTIFNPMKAHQDAGSSKPLITDLQINGGSIRLTNSPGRDTKLRLNHRQNTIAISFSTLDFFNLVNQTYSVKLKGADSGWIDIGRRSQIEYRNLSPGRYTLLLKCNASVTKDASQITTLSFVINPPFWKRWWFYSTVGLMLVIAAYLLYRSRIKNIRKQEMLKTEYTKLVNETEIKALRSQMNPHFIFNSLNAINRYILKNEKKEASEYLSKFSKLIRLILDNSRHAKVPLSQELNAIELYLELESLRFQNIFEYNINRGINISIESIFIPPMLIQPVVENAIWHGLLPKGNDSCLNISLHTEGNHLICAVEDNGIGRQKSAELKKNQLLEKSSVGLSATEQRLRLLSDEKEGKQLLHVTDLTNEQGEASGTRVTILIPYTTKP